MNRPMHRKLIGLAGLVGFYLAMPFADVLHEASGIPDGVLITLLWSLAGGVIGYGFDGLRCTKALFVLALIAGVIIHVMAPFGEWVQSVGFVLGITLVYSTMVYFEGEGLESP